MPSRRYPVRPLVGVGAILFNPTMDRVLMIQRGAPPAEGRWSFPGGLVDAGEPLRQACMREVREETGLAVQLEDLAKVVERVILDDQDRVEYHFVIIDFWGRTSDDLPVKAASDARQACWVPIAEVDRLSTTHGVVQAIARALQLARHETPESPLFEIKQ